MVEFRYATEGELREALGGATPPHSARVIAFLEAGKLLGCGGLYLERAQCRYVLFGNYSERVRQAPRALLRAYRQIMKDRVEGIPVHAVLDEAVPAAERFLLRIGFRPTERGYYELEAA